MANISVAAQERELRRERAELPGKIARASRRVEVLRGDGHRQSPELNRAVEEVRELSARERALPELIADAVARRCRMEAQRLRSEQSALLPEREALEAEAREANNKALLARRAASEARTRMEAIETRMDALGQEAVPFETFAEKTREFEDKPQRLLRLLQDAQRDGLLLPLGVPERSSAQTNGAPQEGETA